MNKIRLDNKDFYYQVFYKKIKNLYLRVSEGNIKITCNKYVTRDKIENFILKNKDKIIKTINQNVEKLPLYSQQNLHLFGIEYNLIFSFNHKKNSYYISNNDFIVEFKNSDFDEKYIEKIYQLETIKKTSKVFNLIKEHIERYINLQNITFKSQLMKTRLGSCIPSKRIIKLNSFLARLDEKYLQAILIHELIHLKIGNHQKEFYQYMNMFVPEYKKFKRELTQTIGRYVI